MPQCPYSEFIKDEVSDKTEQNSLYRAWHEGFEAHKFEMANQMKKLTSLAQMLDNQMRKVNELQTELEKKKPKLQETN
jgi:hypothetical protein